MRRRFSVLLVAMAFGCGEAVREDRAIEFSRDGGQVAFQHGGDGVYVADRDGGGLTKVFQPDETVLATSRPLASPTDGRLIFATAHGMPAQHSRFAMPAPAEGRIDTWMPVQFTCWLRDEPKGDQPPEVRKLFTAGCDHPGYVSAGLAVRWHPDGRRILYVAALDTPGLPERARNAPNAAPDDRPAASTRPGGLIRHSIFEYDLDSDTWRRVFPHAGDAVLCDFSPGGSLLTCVVGKMADAAPGEAPDTGVWIGTPDDASSWWRVPGSEKRSQGEFPSLIESLRASRPAWTRDESRFAFVAQDPENRAEKPARHQLRVVQFADRTTVTAAEADGAITDLHWTPDGRRLGYVQQGEQGAAELRILEPSGEISTRTAGHSIRRFAGFDASGDSLAYVVSDPMTLPAEQLPAGSPWWALLLLPDRQARDSVRIARTDADDAGRDVFSGMQVTFPLWSPIEERLSLWLTFTPRYRSLLSIFRQWGLWPGDPAATIDVQTGTVSWLAVTPQEELQVGHYHLLKRDDAEAWRWYARAREKLPAARPPQGWREFTERVGAPENSQVFEFVCLRRLGRDDEAAAKWTEFERNFFPAAHPDGQPPEAADALLTSFGPQAELLKRLIHDLYVAEAFLSVDALEEAVAHFQAELQSPADDATKLSRAIVLAQLLLISGDHEGYLTHCTEAVVPVALRVWQAQAGARPAVNSQLVLQTAGCLCLAPLFRPEFLHGASDESVRRNMDFWKVHRATIPDGLPAVAADLALRAAAQRLGDKAAADAAEERLSQSPAARALFAGKPIDEVLAQWFAISELRR